MVAPQKHNRQPLFFCLSSAEAREASTFPRAKGNTKAPSPPGPEATADCACWRQPTLG